MTLLLTLLLTTAAQFDRAGRDCFMALRDFQVIELREVQAKHVWPTFAQQQEIAAKLYIAYEGITDGLAIGVTPVLGHPQALSWMRSLQSTIASLVAMVGPLAPKDARHKIQDVQDRFAALLALYPVGDVDEHPPVVKK